MLQIRRSRENPMPGKTVFILREDPGYHKHPFHRHACCSACATRWHAVPSNTSIGQCQLYRVFLFVRCTCIDMHVYTYAWQRQVFYKFLKRKGSPALYTVLPPFQTIHDLYFGNKPRQHRGRHPMLSLHILSKTTLTWNQTALFTIASYLLVGSQAPFDWAINHKYGAPSRHPVQYSSCRGDPSNPSLSEMDQPLSRSRVITFPTMACYDLSPGRSVATMCPHTGILYAAQISFQCRSRCDRGHRALIIWHVPRDDNFE